MSDDRQRIARYLARADELRAVAETMKDAQSKALVQEIAQEYVKLANSIAKLERTAKGVAPP